MKITVHTLLVGYDDSSLVSDISLIKLAAPVTFTDYIAPACLPTHNVDVAVGLNCTITGWGNTEGICLFVFIINTC